MKWKKVKISNNYSVSEYGDIRNDTTGKILKPKIDRYGYKCINIYNNDGKRIYPTIHRLVALEYNVKTEGSTQVNHKDGNKLNNHYTNLEWCTVRYNIVHSYANKLNTNVVSILVTDISTNKTKEYYSIKSFCREIGIKASAFLPLIKSSFVNPILSKYKVILVNEEELLNTSNVINFGKPVYVYDKIKDKVIKYPSVNVASYYTELRSIDFRENVNLTRYLRLGYSISYNENDLIKDIEYPNNVIVNNRIDYTRKPYIPNIKNKVYLIYDYLNKKEYKFHHYLEIKEFLLKNLSFKFTDKYLTTKIFSKNKYGNSLIGGYGISDNIRMKGKTWYPYTEELILLSKMNIKYKQRVYKVIDLFNNKESIIVGLNKLLRMFNVEYQNVRDYDKFIDKINGENKFKIIRLNKPISDIDIVSSYTKV